ncbi:MAG: hypothetical protein AAGA54_17340 [Myxococcota bacterium]
MPTPRVFAFSSSLPLEHRDQAERMLFFNNQQKKIMDGIRAVAKKYGHPKLVEDGDRLRLRVTSTVETQTLFVSTHGLGPVGAIIFTREENALVALYMAVHEDFSTSGPRASDKLVVHLFKEFESIACRVKGVEQLHLYLGAQTPIKKSVRRRRG